MRRTSRFAYPPREWRRGDARRDLADARHIKGLEIKHVSFIRASSGAHTTAMSNGAQWTPWACRLCRDDLSSSRRALQRCNLVSSVDEHAGGVELTTKGSGSETALVRRTRLSSRIIRLTSRNTLLSANEIIPQLDKPAIAFARYRTLSIFGDDGTNEKLYSLVFTDTNFGTHYIIGSFF